MKRLFQNSMIKYSKISDLETFKLPEVLVNVNVKIVLFKGVSEIILAKLQYTYICTYICML